MAKDSRGSAYTQPADFRPVRTLLPYLWPKKNTSVKTRVIIAASFVVISKIATIWIPIFYKKAVNLIGEGVDLHFRLVIFFLLAYGTSRALSIIFLELKDFLFAKVEHRAIRLIATKVFDHLHRLSLQFHFDRKTGSLVRSLERGTKAIEDFFRYSTFSIIPTALEVCIAVLTITYLYGFAIGGLTALNIILYVYYTLKVTQARAKFLRRMHDAENQTGHRAVESLLNYETVKYFGNESLERARFEKAQLHYEKSAVHNKVGLSVLNTGQGVIISLGLMGLMSLFALKIKEGVFTVGDLVLINVYLLQLYVPLNMLGFAYREIKRSLIEMAAMFSLFDALPDIKDQADCADLVFKGGNVTFDRVSFSYGAGRDVLKDVSFDVPSGKKVALVGGSGSGKTTLSRLLFRFYDPLSGTVQIDGQNIKNVRQDSVRQMIGIVPQDTILFNESIFYNIQYGNIQATEADVHRVAKAAKIHDFILSLPEGYDTVVGERGVKLSGGEKQRVAIARTLLKKPKIFLFDEATSALDTHTEKALQENLNEISKGCTTLAIAHRLSTIVDAHKIIVLDKGRIVEEGSHHSLLKKKGYYAALWEKQSRKANENP